MPMARLPRLEAGFSLDHRLEADTRPLMWLGLCEVRVMNDRRWPWLVLVPQRPGIAEIHDLTPLDQTMLTFEMTMAAEALKSVTRCFKINTGALGNIVRQLHLHVVARNEGDANWPGPVWGHGPREPWKNEDFHRFAESVREAM